MAALLQCYRFGLVGYRTKHVARFFNNPLVIVYFDVDYVNNAKATKYWRNRFDSRSVLAVSWCM